MEVQTSEQVQPAKERRKAISYFLSFLPLALFLSSWMASAFCIPVAYFLSVAWNFHHLTAVLVLYYIYRMFFRLPCWDFVVSIRSDELSLVLWRLLEHITRQPITCGIVKANQTVQTSS